MLYFRLGAACYLVGGISSHGEVYNNNVVLTELDDFEVEDCGCWQYIVFYDSTDSITVRIADYEDMDEIVNDINKFTGSTLYELTKFLKKERIDFTHKCLTS